MRVVEYPPLAPVFKQGDKGNELYIVVRGSVSLSMTVVVDDEVEPDPPIPTTPNLNLPFSPYGSIACRRISGVSGVQYPRSPDSTAISVSSYAGSPLELKRELR